MARTSALQAEGRGFESHLLHICVSLWLLIGYLQIVFIIKFRFLVITFVDDINILDASLAQLDRATAF